MRCEQGMPELPKKPHNRGPGFAAMDPEQHRKVSAQGGTNGSRSLKSKARRAKLGYRQTVTVRDMRGVRP